MPVIKSLVTALHDLLVCQRAEMGQKRSKEAELWEMSVSQHAAVKALKHQAAVRLLVKENSGTVDILKATLGDDLSEAVARPGAGPH